jgi:ArsR family transcriptional regulator, arsenate/arsenite/antimonite-responsive transcriptional repressor
MPTNLKAKRKSTKSTRPIDLMFRAFSDRTRLRILYLLKEGESCVGDLVEVLRIDQPRVSRHLDYLKKAGLVYVRRSRTWRFYSLAPAQGAFHEKLLECLTCCFGEVPQLQTDRLRATKLKKSGGGCCPELETPDAKKTTQQGSCC